MYLIINKWVIAVKVSNFSGQYLRNHRTLDIGVLGYIGIVWPKEHSPEVRSFPPGTPCISVIMSEREPYTMNWSSSCLIPLCYLSIGPSRTVILKYNFSFEKLFAVRQLQQNIFGGFRFSFRTSELTGRMFQSRPWHNSLFSSSQLLFLPNLLLCNWVKK